MFRILIIVSFLALVYSQSDFQDIYIDQGPVRGFNVDADDVFSFYGIPYATAPTGDDKFKDALPPRNWTDEFYANVTDVICPQMETNIDEYFLQNRTLDCLVVNIFMPNTNETNLPVFVNIHGGGFQEGMGTLFSSIDMVKRGLVTVTFNYRVGVLGYLCLNTEFAPGNAGLKDSVLALKWIKHNIAYFGGDPNNIFIAGSSSGGAQVELLMLYEGANDLFHKASSESGSGLKANYENLAIAENFANRFGVYTNQSVEELENFYRNLPEEYLNVGAYESEIMFWPCIETHNITGVEIFLPKAPLEIVAAGDYLQRPYLIGLTVFESLSRHIFYADNKLLMEENFTQFLPTDLVFDSEESRDATVQKIKQVYFPTGEITLLGFIQYYSDISFSYDIVTSARVHSMHSVPVYYYLFSYNGTVNLPGAWDSPIKGPGHIAQTMYIQDYKYPGCYDNMTDDDRFIQELMRDMWYNFCKYGEPIPSTYSSVNITWPQMTAGNEIYLNIDLELSVGISPLHERISVWDEIYSSDYNSSANKTDVLSLIIYFVLALVMTNVF